MNFPAAHEERSQQAVADPPGATVYIVDDDESFLRSVTRLLRARGFSVAPHASAAAFLRDLTPATGGCVVTDLMMPGLDGLELQEALRRAGSSLPVLFLTGQGDIPATVMAMRGGAEDFLTKDAPQEHLVAAVNRALRRDEENRARNAETIAFREKFSLLTVREREVLRQVVAGKLNKQIAADLGIHERTVKLHRTNLTGKLQVFSVAELARLVQDTGVFV